MTDNELTLFKIIFENDQPERAVMTAIEVFTAFLEQLSKDPEQPPDDLPVSA